MWRVAKRPQENKQNETISMFDDDHKTDDDIRKMENDAKPKFKVNKSAEIYSTNETSKRYQYELKHLVDFRNYASCREMPTFIDNLDEFEDLGLIFRGAGLKARPVLGFTLRFEKRMLQINIAKASIGYQNYTSLIPRNDRTSNHPSTPPNYDLSETPKKQFDRKVKYWKTQLHQWDNITSTEQIPEHLTTFIIQENRRIKSQRPSNTRVVRTPTGCSWSPAPKKSKKTKSRYPRTAPPNSKVERHRDYDDDDCKMDLMTSPELRENPVIYSSS